MDPLSDVLSLLQPRSHISAGFDAGGDWSVAFTGNIGIKCYAIVSGQCWLSVEGVAQPVQLHAGDAFLLPTGKPFYVASDPALAPIPARDVFSTAQRGGVITHNGGGDVFMVGSRFEVEGKHADILLGMLPPIVHLQDKADQSALRWLVERMMHELREPQPGSHLVAQHLAHLMLVQALRLHSLHINRVAQGMVGMNSTGTGVGWLFALADKQIGAAISAMHAWPAQSWTLQMLAAQIGMSRSSFALKFKAMVGLAPMDYLTRWRMLLASDKLVNSKDPISVIAPALGYESESAFSTAFKRIMGCSPRQYPRSAAAAKSSQAGLPI